MRRFFAEKNYEKVNYWCDREELNLRPFGPQPNALSPELRPQIQIILHKY
jgi:hypothetical protein